MGRTYKDYHIPEIGELVSHKSNTMGIRTVMIRKPGHVYSIGISIDDIRHIPREDADNLIYESAVRFIDSNNL